MRDDGPKEIKKCLNCKFGECIDCIGDHATVYGAKTLKRMERIQELWDQGLTDKAIALRLGVTRSHVSDLRRRMGLAPNAGRFGGKKIEQPADLRG